jgi:hypothetical protein
MTSKATGDNGGPVWVLLAVAIGVPLGLVIAFKAAGYLVTLGR